MKLPFVKTQALGNDFILVRAGEAGGDPVGLAVAICERRLGVGADGLVLWEPADDRTFEIRIFNRDGSEAESSGNGMRCMAAYLFESGRAASDAEVRLRTVAGSYRFRREGEAYTADMGVPALRPAEIPFVAEGEPGRIVDYPLEVSGESLRITACSTGNPHCSLFVDAIDEDVVGRLGPLIESHPRFPNRTNVEFVHVLGDDAIEVAFWERGAGRTPASGTGSCGAAVAAVLNRKTGRRIRVHAGGGDLDVEWGEDNRLRLTSTAEVVAEGHYSRG